jgi:hypothetical protein
MYNLLYARRVETWMTVPTDISILIDTNYQLPTGLHIKLKFSLYRPWRPLGLREVEAPTFSDNSANSWRQGCQLYAPATFYPEENSW